MHIMPLWWRRARGNMFRVNDHQNKLRELISCTSYCQGLFSRKILATHADLHTQACNKKTQTWTNPRSGFMHIHWACAVTYEQATVESSQCNESRFGHRHSKTWQGNYGSWAAHALYTLNPTKKIGLPCSGTRFNRLTFVRMSTKSRDIDYLYHAISCSCAETLIYWIVSQSTIVRLFSRYTEQNVNQCILNGSVLRQLTCSTKRNERERERDREREREASEWFARQYSTP
jgi:hypothetical protein